MCTCKQIKGGRLGEHEADKDQLVQLLQAHGEASVIAGQALVAGPPTQAALDDPAARKQHETALGLAELDLPQVDAVDFGRLGRPLVRISLNGVVQRDALSKSHLYF